MKGNDELNNLFRNRLTEAEMPVRNGFWEELQRNLPQTGIGDESQEVASLPVATRPARFLHAPKFYRIAAAASVGLLLGVASAAFWYFSPNEEIKEAFTQVAVLTPEGSLKGDVVQEKFPSIHEAKPTAQKSGATRPAGTGTLPLPLSANAADEETVSVQVSITITERVFANRQSGNGLYNGANLPYTSYGNTASTHREAADATPPTTSHGAETTQEKEDATGRSPQWALKAGVGTALPKDGFNAPFTAGVSVERSLNKNFSLEAGVQYNRLPSDRVTLHTLSVPVKLHAYLAATPKVDFYATVGAAIEKCIAGAPNNSFGAEPLQLAVSAGLGVRYKLNERFALFAEPSVSHHLRTDSPTASLRTDRPTNLNLLCGVRMTY